MIIAEQYCNCIVVNQFLFWLMIGHITARRGGAGLRGEVSLQGGGGVFRTERRRDEGFTKSDMKLTSAT